jgi:phosphoglycerate kinase
MDLKTPNASLVKDKNVIVRLDLNTQEVDTINYRFLATKETISYLLKSKAKTIIVLAHLGRPEKDKHSLKINDFDYYNEKLSLKKFKNSLTKIYKTKVFFFKHSVYSDKFEKYFSGKKLPKIILLENIRFYKGEVDNDKNLAKIIANIGDLFINDAFSVAHRKAMSNNVISKVLPSFYGFNYIKEIKNLNKVIDRSKNNLAVIIGGAKIKDKIDLVLKFAKNSKYVLIGGGIANSFLYSMGCEVGKSIYEDISNINFKKLDFSKVLLPVDVKIINQFGVVDSKMCADIDSKDMILDIGDLAIEEFVSKIKECNYVF